MGKRGGRAHGKCRRIQRGRSHFRNHFTGQHQQWGISDRISCDRQGDYSCGTLVVVAAWIGCFGLFVFLQESFSKSLTG
jgi:hypothetical protein